MRTRSEKKPDRKNDRKVLVAEESNKNWADSDSDSTTSSSSSSDSEQEEVHCLMEYQTTTEYELYETQNPLNDKSGLGFCVGESSFEGTSTQSDLPYDKFKTMNFVKANLIHNAYESVKYNDQIAGQLNQKGKAGIGYIRPENSKRSWLKNRLEKDKAKSGSKVVY
ncbi:hypothetical protein F511_43417 [Dorcoceras hygrometricum]|uniref:Uncharacterized protein n=1 Tax=Dorcoceras hygrometricum TaxID=472368 RepID=A0A2Z7APQ2_9LAMI|nr:hypothetical protein F511_43417 [Dorcoceras hygrometricum]